MTTRWVALLRGINVGGHRKLPMAELRALVAREGGARVHTVVQSGNVVFDHGSGARQAAALRARLERAIAETFGFDVPVMLRTATQFEAVAAADPFAAVAAEPTHAHTVFLDGIPSAADRSGLDRLAAEGERWHLDGDTCWLHLPGGAGNSKLAAGVEKRLGVGATARNRRTVDALRALLVDA